MTRRPWRGRLVQQVAARRRVGSDRVDAELRHQAEVAGDLSERRKLVAVRVGREGPVGHALDEEPSLVPSAAVIEAQKFPVRDDPRG